MAKLIPELDELTSFTSEDLLVIHDTSASKDFKIKMENVVPTSLAGLKLGVGESLEGVDNGGTDFDIIRNTGVALLIGTDGTNNIAATNIISPLVVSEEASFSEDIKMTTVGKALYGTGFNGVERKMLTQSSFDLIVGDPNTSQVIIDNTNVVVGESTQPQAQLDFRTANNSSQGSLVFSNNSTNSYIDFKGPDFQIRHNGAPMFVFDPSDVPSTVRNIAPFKTESVFIIHDAGNILSETSGGQLRNFLNRFDDTTLNVGNSTDTLNLIGDQILVNGVPLTGGGGGGEYINREGFDGTASADIARFNITMKNDQFFMGKNLADVAVPLLGVDSADTVKIGTLALDAEISANTLTVDASTVSFTGNTIFSSVLVANQGINAQGKNLISNPTGNEVLIGDATTDVTIASQNLNLAADVVLDTNKKLKGTLQDLTTEVDMLTVNIADQVELGAVGRDTIITGDDIVFNPTGITDQITFNSNIFLADNIAVEGMNGNLLVNNITDNRVQLGGDSGIPVRLKGGFVEIEGQGLTRLVPAANGNFTFSFRDSGNVDDFYVLSGNATTGGISHILSGTAGTLEMINTTSGNLSLVAAGGGAAQLISTQSDVTVAASNGDVTISAGNSNTLNLDGGTVLVNGAPIGGGGGSSTLQQAYNLSTTQPLIETGANGAFTVRQSNSSVDPEVIAVEDVNGDKTFAVDQAGGVYVKPSSGNLAPIINPNGANNTIAIGHPQAATSLSSQVNLTSEIRTANGAAIVLSSGNTPIFGDATESTTIQGSNVTIASNNTIIDGGTGTTSQRVIGNASELELLATNNQTTISSPQSNLEITANGSDVNVSANTLTYNGEEVATTNQTGVQSVVAGTGIVVNNTDPANPVVSAPANSAPTTQAIFSANATLTANKIISPVSGEGEWTSTPMGFSTGDGGTVVSVEIALEQFITNNTVSNVEVAFSYLPADGTRTAPFFAGAGTQLGTVDFTLPNSSGATRYYVGFEEESMNWVIPNGVLVFCHIVAQTAQAASGIVVTLDYEPN